MVEGATETALKAHLKRFLDARAQNERRSLVRLETRTEVNLVQGRFQRRVRQELAKSDVTAVVALLDVYPDYQSAEEAKADLRQKAGNLDNFYAHAAQYEVEAWLLPYWQDICQRVGRNQRPPGGAPEEVNLNRPPSHYLDALYRLAKRKYVKTTEMSAILKGKDLTIAANRCPEFKAFLNTLLMLNGLSQLL
jgi:hypothetical protein